jgi:ubiquinone/menaquinone biosynthesis C-methylase UbiE
MTDTITKVTYQTFQQGKSIFSFAHKSLSNRLMNLVAPDIKPGKPLSSEVLQKIQQRLQEIQEVDWQDAELGIYPTDALFDNPWEDFFRYYPMLCLDMPQIWNRVVEKKYQDFSSDINIEGYPKYYVQNFHHQTNGYLSDLSANLYDLQVEILFGGSADAMRRRILKPLKYSLQKADFSSTSQSSTPQRDIKILDIATGTGRTLKFLRVAFPFASLFGADLSPAYLRKANELLSQIPGELPQLVQANVEELPYLDNYFHATTSVFLFHELPQEARQRVIEEAFRVTKPGGVFIICDSIQLSDSPDFEPIMDNFPHIFHEPYYKHYVNDDLVERLQKAGFKDIQTEVHFMSKYLIAKK